MSLCHLWETENINNHNKVRHEFFFFVADMCTYKSINTIIISRAVAVENMKQILYSDWLFDGLILPAWDCSLRSGARKTLTKFVIIGQCLCYKRKKTAEDSQNKENINDSRGFIVPQSQLVLSPGFRNVQVIFDSK